MRGFAQGGEEEIAALGDTTGAEPDVDLGGICARPMIVFAEIVDRFCGTFKAEEILDDIGEFLGGELAVGGVFEFNYRGKSTTTQAGHALDGEFPFGISVLAGRNVQMTAKGLFDAIRASNMTGGAMTDMNDMFPDGLMSKLVVKGGDAPERGGLDISDGTDTFQSRLGQVAILLLNRLQNGDDRVRRAADTLDGLIHEAEVFSFHRLLWED
jgi:hypothetical protein